MKKLYVSANVLIVGHLRKVLENQGIACVIRNEYLLGAAGDLPANECWPELWVTDDRDYEPARRLVDAYTGPGDVPRPAWSCPTCNEWLEGQFSHCWRCGAERPDD